MPAERIRFAGLPAWRLSAPGGTSAVVLEHGAQVISWQAGGVERLFVSEGARFQEGHHVRGGIPVSFPQFDRRGPLPRHGFARLFTWDMADAGDEGGTATLRLRFRDDARTRAIWPCAFRLSLQVQLAFNALEVRLEVANPGAHAMSFTAALHSYLRCGDVEGVELRGLHARRFVDNATGEQGLDAEQALRVRGRLGRTYPRPDDDLVLIEDGARLTISSDGFEDIVVWNPHEAGASLLDDLPPDGWRHMICVEAAQVLRASTVNAGGTWLGSQRLSMQA